MGDVSRKWFSYLLIASLGWATACGSGDSPPVDAGDAGDAAFDVGVDMGGDAGGRDLAMTSDAAADLGGDAGGPDETAQYFEAVRGVRDTLRESPDHLAARADALVAARDAEGLFDFVRDEIALVPSVEGAVRSRFVDSATAVMAGPRGALRGGAGTMRDRAELLARLYRRAGWEAEVVGPWPGAISRSDYEAALFAPVSHEFSLPESSPALERAGRRLPSADGEEGSLEIVEADTSDLESLLLDRIPAVERGALAVDDRAELDLPIVRLERGDEVLHLDVVSPAAGFVDVSEAAGLAAMPEADYADVHVRLSMATTRRPDIWQPLLERVWQADEVVGRQIMLRFEEGLSIEEQLAMTRDEVEVAVPMAFVQDPELDDAAGWSLGEIGDPFTLAGSRITESPDGDFLLDGVAFAGGDEIGPLDRVESLASLEAEPSRFARVELRVDALDADGGSVAGLGAGAFEVREEGRPVAHTMRRTRVAPLRLLLLFDTSGSVGAYWKQPAFATHLGQLLDALQSEYVGEVQAAAANIDSSMIEAERGAWTGDGAELEAQVQAIFGDLRLKDPIWRGLEQAAPQRHDLTIVFSDGKDTISGFDPARRLLLSSGPPALILGTGVLSPLAEEMAEFTGGATTEMQVYADANAPITGWVRRQPGQRYILTYRAPGAGPEQREVIVETSDGRRAASTTYRVPPPGERETAEELVGLRLEVAVDGRRVTRLLGGIDPSTLTSTEIPEAARRDVRRVLASEYAISVEAQAPLFGQWMDDYLTYRLGQEDLYRAYHTEDTELGLDVFERGYRHVDPRVFNAYPSLDEPYASPDRRSFAVGPRVAIASRWWDVDEEAVARRFDILPISQFVTRRADGTSDFAETFRQTARFAVAEAHNYATSTTSLLDGQALLRIAPGAAFEPATDFEATVDDETADWWRRTLSQYERWHRFVPSDGATRALWIVHGRTGEVYGLLPDGSGGGAVQERLADYARIKEVIEEFDAVAGGGPPKDPRGKGAFMEYLKVVVRMYAAATVVILNLDAYSLPEAVRGSLLAITCNFVKTTLIVEFERPTVETHFDIFETLTAEFGVERPAACAAPTGG